MRRVRKKKQRLSGYRYIRVRNFEDRQLDDWMLGVPDGIKTEASQA